MSERSIPRRILFRAEQSQQPHAETSELHKPFPRLPNGDLDIKSIQAELTPYVFRVAFEHGIKDGEDILQATLLKVYLHADSLNFGVWTTWATRIALNLCRDIVRREQTLRRIRPPYRGEIQDVLHVSDTKEPVQELVERRELGEELTSVLDALPPLYRRAIYMRHVENRSVKEIATREGLTESAVKSLLFRARAAARKLYENSIQTSARDGVGARQDGAL